MRPYRQDNNEPQTRNERKMDGQVFAALKYGSACFIIDMQGHHRVLYLEQDQAVFNSSYRSM